MTSNMVTKELYLRHDLVNVQTGEKIEQNYNGQKMHSFVTKTYKDENVDAKWGYLSENSISNEKKSFLKKCYYKINRL